MPKHIDTTTARALIQRARRGIEAQGRPARARDIDGPPVFITPDGDARSTVGHLLSAEQARDAQARGLDPTDPEIAVWVLGEDSDAAAWLLREIRDAHDDSMGQDEFVRSVVEELDRLEVDLADALRRCSEPARSASADPDAELLRSLVERATRALVEQGGPATDDRGRPMVITPDGARRSSLGWLLTEEQARESQRRGLEPRRDGELALWVFGEDTPAGRDFLEWIREAHDIRCCDFLAGFEHDMGVMRDAWGLCAANPRAVSVDVVGSPHAE